MERVGHGVLISPHIIQKKPSRRDYSPPILHNEIYLPYSQRRVRYLWRQLTGAYKK